MAITLVGTTDGLGYDSLDPWSGTTAIAAQPGDVVFATIGINNNASPSSYFGAGGFTATSTATVGAFTVYSGTAASGTAVEQVVGVAVVTGAGDVVLSADMQGARSGRFVVSVFRGVDTTTPIASTSAIARGTSTSPAASSVTPGKAGDWVVAVSQHMPVSNTWTSTSTWTDVKKYNSTSTYTVHIGTLVEYKEAPDTSALAGAPAISTSALWVARNFVLNAIPDVVPGTTVARGFFI